MSAQLPSRALHSRRLAPGDEMKSRPHPGGTPPLWPAVARSFVVENAAERGHWPWNNRQTIATSAPIQSAAAAAACTAKPVPRFSGACR